MNTNKNSYTLIYMTIVIVIVSLLLSFTADALKERQSINVELDKKKQILSSLNLDLEGQNIASIYSENIKKYLLVNAEGEITKDISDQFNYKLQADELPIYIAQINGETKYIIPLNGAGLWGAIWGYIALNDDCNTVYGIYFSHASETPGLGANIATKNFQKQFQDKHIFNSQEEFVSIAVMKAGQTAADKDQVDAISGGTITSKGVENMLKSNLEKYTAFFIKNKKESTK